MTAAHLDTDTLADLQEGLLQADEAVAASAHLAGCPQCRAQRDALDDLRGTLRAHAGLGSRDETMPADVAERVDAALAAAAADHPAPDDVAASGGGTVVPLSARQPWHTRALQIAAVVVILAAVGGVVYGSLFSGSGSSDTSTSAGSASGGKSTPQAPVGSFPVSASGRAYTTESLRTAVPGLLAGTTPQRRALLAQRPTAASGDGAQPEADGVDTRLLDPSALAACVVNITDAPGTPLAVDVGRYEGRPATIIVLPTPDDAAYVDVYAVAPTCPKGTFYTFSRVARP